MNALTFSVEDSPSAKDLEFLEEQINSYNMQKTGQQNYQPVAIFLRDNDKKILAGLSGYTWAGFCEIAF